MKVVLCDRCNKWEVRPDFVLDTNVQFWKCGHCGEVRGWCPFCNQGWIRHGIIQFDQTHLYSCDECDAAWLNRTDIGTDKSTSVGKIAEEKDKKAWELKIETIKDQE